MHTTINKLRDRGALGDILESLRKTYTDDAPIKISAILASNGLADALQCLHGVDGYDKELRLYAVWCARQVQHLMTDDRSLAALDVAERHAYGRASDEELMAARRAVSNAAGAAAGAAAWAAARAAAGAAAGAAAWSAAGADVWGAAGAAAYAAARSAQAAKLCEVCELIDIYRANAQN